MLNHNEDTKKVLLGVLIGGILGGGALYLLHKREKPVLNRIGESIAQVGEMLEGCNVEEKDGCKKDDTMLANAIDLATTGFSLWKKIKKRM